MPKRYKKQDETSYCLGATLVMELLNKKPELARAVYISQKCDVTAIEKRAGEVRVPVIVSDKTVNALSPKGNCFAVGLFDKFETDISGNRHHVVLVNPSDGGNLGTIIRTVAAFDCFDIAIIRPAADRFEPKTVRASMGAIFDVNIKEYDGFDEYVKQNPDREITPFMLTGKPLKSYAFDAENKKYSLVFGNEATGLPTEFQKYGGVKIEQSKKADSLNLSIAVGVGLINCTPLCQTIRIPSAFWEIRTAFYNPNIRRVRRS